MSRPSLLASLLPLLAIPVSGLAPQTAESQAPPVYRLSQRANVVQHLANTTVTVEYSRPAARGRSPLFGTVVHFGEVWTPGANEATVLELSDDATIEGHAVSAGRWSMWMIPSEVGDWELLLHPTDTLFHTMRPEVGAEGQIRFDVRNETSEHVELLTWDFPEVDRHRGTLRMSWGQTRVPLAIEVEPNLPETIVSDAVAARYVGEWRVTAEVPPDAPGENVPPPFTMTLRHDERGVLRVELPRELMFPPTPDEPLDEDASARERERAEGQRAAAEQLAGDWYYMALVPFAEGIFRQGFFLSDHTLVDVENAFIEFALDGDGEATGFVIRGVEDQVMARGARGGGSGP